MQPVGDLVLPCNTFRILLYFIELNVKDFDGVTDWCKRKNIDLVVVGPEDPLAGGLADHLQEHGLFAVF